MVQLLCLFWIGWVRPAIAFVAIFYCQVTIKEEEGPGHAFFTSVVCYVEKGGGVVEFTQQRQSEIGIYTDYFFTFVFVFSFRVFKNLM